MNDESIFADEIITGRVIQKNAITAELLERTLAPCVVEGIKNISISNILTIPITDLFTYNTANGKWQSTIVNITNATSSGNNADLEINCGDIGIDKVKFSQMPAIIPVIIISDGDIITVNVSVKSEFKGHSYKSDNIILVSQGGYVSLMLAKTSFKERHSRDISLSGGISDPAPYRASEYAGGTDTSVLSHFHPVLYGGPNRFRLPAGRRKQSERSSTDISETQKSRRKEIS